MMVIVSVVITTSTLFTESIGSGLKSGAWSIR